MNKVDEINQLLAASTHHRDQLDSMASEFAKLHGEALGSCEADELMSCIYDGVPYEDAMRRVLRIKKHRRKA